MRAFLDTCVIYPTVMREMLIGAAKLGLYEPQWSERVLEEWVRAARKLGPEGEALARGDRALLESQFPKAAVRYGDGLEARLWLPDENDRHVLAGAISGSADVIVTVNAKDFPRHILAEEGVSRADPDLFLLGFFEADPDAVIEVARGVLDTAQRLSGEDWTIRALMKKARLPRLGKALAEGDIL
ncbi:MAG: PIN domain-containing protein [Pseudomonadota bacterium]